MKDITQGNGLDQIVDVALGQNAAMDIQLLKPNGILSTFESGTGRTPEIPFYDFLFKVATIRFVFVYNLSTQAKQKAIDDITDCLKAGVLKFAIHRHFPLLEIASAHEQIEQGKALGRTLIDLPLT